MFGTWAWFVLGWGISEILPQSASNLHYMSCLKKFVVYLHYMASCLGFGVIMCGVLCGFYKLTEAPDYLHTMKYECQTDSVL